jgi:hypothetical protein
VGLRPLVCFAKRLYYTTVLSFLIYAPRAEKDKSPSSRVPTFPEPKDYGTNRTNKISLAPGGYSVRVVVPSNVTGKIGSVTPALTGKLGC